MNLNYSYLSSGVGLLKIGIVILGLVTFVVGMCSHVESDWKRKNVHSQCKWCDFSGHGGYGYRDKGFFSRMSIYDFTPSQCPGIWMEVFFVVVITCSFCLSSIFLVLSVMLEPGKMERRIAKALDFAQLMFFCVITIVSGFFFIYSAAKIDQFLERNSVSSCIDASHATFLIGGKIVAGVLAMKLGVLYGITSMSVWRDSWDEMRSSLLL